MIIKVLGKGCKNCSRLEDNVNIALKETGIDATVEKVTDLDAIIEHGIMKTPGLMIDGTVISQGKILSPNKIQAHLTKSS